MFGVCTCVSLQTQRIFDCMFNTDALFEKKQIMMTNEDDIAKLRAQVETSSAEKHTLIAKYEAMIKESEGQINVE